MCILYLSIFVYFFVYFLCLCLVAQEANVKVDPALSEPFMRMHKVLEGLKRKELDLALECVPCARCVCLRCLYA